MSLKKLSVNELVERLGVVLEQVLVVKRGLKEHPEDETFQKAAMFFKDEGNEIMREIKSRK